eukprot:6023682-Prymnesium_polylepis.1
MMRAGRLCPHGHGAWHYSSYSTSDMSVESVTRGRPAAGEPDTSGRALFVFRFGELLIYESLQS